MIGIIFLPYSIYLLLEIRHLRPSQKKMIKLSNIIKTAKNLKQKAKELIQSFIIGKILQKKKRGLKRERLIREINYKLTQFFLTNRKYKEEKFRKGLKIDRKIEQIQENLKKLERLSKIE